MHTVYRNCNYRVLNHTIYYINLLHLTTRISKFTQHGQPTLNDLPMDKDIITQLRTQDINPFNASTRYIKNTKHTDDIKTAGVTNAFVDCLVTVPFCLLYTSDAADE